MSCSKENLYLAHYIVILFCFRDVEKVVELSQAVNHDVGNGPECDGNGFDIEVKMKQVDVHKLGREQKKRKFKEPQCDYVMNSVSHKDFAPQGKHKIKWAVNMYVDWRNQRMKCENCPNEIMFADLDRLGMFTQNDLAFSLARFIREIKKLDDSEYSPNTLGEILIMIQMYLHQNDVFWKVLDHAEFVTLRNVLDNMMHEHTVLGLGVKNSSEIISLEKENKLFVVGELGDSNPQ